MAIMKDTVGVHRTREIRSYRVGIDKSYFPKNLQPRNITNVFEVVKVRAGSRIDAAQKAWDRNRSRWLPIMVNPKGKVSLYVNDPGSGPTGIMMRLIPIQVFDGEHDERKTVHT